MGFVYVLPGLRREVLGPHHLFLGSLVKPATLCFGSLGDGERWWLRGAGAQPTSQASVSCLLSGWMYWLSG